MGILPHSHRSAVWHHVRDTEPPGMSIPSSDDDHHRHSDGLEHETARVKTPIAESPEPDRASSPGPERDNAELPVPARQPTRQVYQADALTWMAEHASPPKTSVITSLPDVSELAGHDLESWKRWFVSAAQRVIRWVDDGLSIFYQSDIRHEGRWIDKGYLVMCAAEDEGAFLVWHKIVCRRPPLTVAVGRPSYSHMICVSRCSRPLPTRPGPDVLPAAGHMPWSRAMGVRACEVACQFLRDETDTRTVVDPFCGRGTLLAVANDLGFDAIGVDIGGKRCRIARNLRVRLT
jgi:hypothetical protein